MTSRQSGGIGFWSTVVVLLRAARRRGVSRFHRQRELLQQRGSRPTLNASSLGLGLAVIVLAVLNAAGALAVRNLVEVGGRYDAERSGRVLVSEEFFEALREGTAGETTPVGDGRRRRSAFAREALRLADTREEAPAIEERLRQTAQRRGLDGFISEGDTTLQLATLTHAGRLPSLLGSLGLLVWGTMLVCSGEGVVFDMQRRRHPIWEWLFSHPVPMSAVFVAEMLSPLAANPVYVAAPVFVGVLYATIYSPLQSVSAGLLAGVPLVVGAACFGRAIEIALLLRASGRSRGAFIGLMNWMGFLCLPLLPAILVADIGSAVAWAVSPLTALPWPLLGWFLGSRPDGSFSFAAGLFACWSTAVASMAGSVMVCVWAVGRGLVAPSPTRATVPVGPRRKAGVTRFRREPLFYKECLWFVRDRSALVEAILIPLTVAASQLFQFRGVASRAGSGWHVLAAGAVLFGTYFISILGPKSLTSEGSALWLSLTWPRGLESLLRAKAWLWSIITSTMVFLILGFAVARYPADAWRIALVALGWTVFCRSMADKSVTLVTTTSTSGQPEPVPWGRRMAAQLGMVTFAVGVLNQQWPMAFMGIVYSYATAAAMWQYFRARLPFLHDPWSETLPAPPTLMHAMVAISLLGEGGGLVTGVLTGLTGRGNYAVAAAVGYLLSAVAVAFGTSQFLANRGVAFDAVRNWQGSRLVGHHDLDGRRGVRFGLLLGALGGVTLSVVALGWAYLLRHYAIDSEAVRLSTERMTAIPHLRLAFAVTAIGIAPFAEEYLFRGLLFQAMHREWSDWRATVGSALFFAVLHPPTAWIPVGLVGLANAELFKRTGRLGPAVALHRVYNAMVVGISL